MKKISKTKIEKRIRKKVNPFLVETLIKLKKSKPEIAKILAGPVKKQAKFNLMDIEKHGNSKSIVVLGKVLSVGDLTKKVKIVALSASEKAKEKIKKSGSEFANILEEIKKNPELKGLEVLK